MIFLFAPVAFAAPASMGSAFRDGAIVGKVICKSDITEYYIVYGRLSNWTSQGYRVYETGKFYYVNPTDQKSRKFIESRVGQGIKAFGTFEIVPDSSQAEIMITNDIIEYDPQQDVGKLEPAYGGNAGPHPWLAFGVAKKQNTASMINMEKSTTVINTLVHLSDLIYTEGHTLCTEVKGKEHETNTVLPDRRKDKKYPIEDVVGAVAGDKTEFTPKDPKYRGPIRNFWQVNIHPYWLLEPSQALYEKMNKSLRGYMFIEGLLGKINNLYENIPSIRPEMDIFMEYIENQSKDKTFSKWASPAVFYGFIDGEPEEKSYLMATPRPNPKNPFEQFVSAMYIGPYYPEDQPHILVDAVTEVITGRVPKIESTEDNQSELYRNKEQWPIGWRGEGSLYPGFTVAQYKQYKGHNVWMTGGRVLVYEIKTCDPEGCSTSIVHIEHGSMEEGTTTTTNASGETSTTTVTLIGHYIKVDHILIKPQYNYLLDLMREITFKGGV